MRPWKTGGRASVTGLVLLRVYLRGCVVSELGKLLGSYYVANRKGVSIKNTRAWRCSIPLLLLSWIDYVDRYSTTATTTTTTAFVGW